MFNLWIFFQDSVQLVKNQMLYPDSSDFAWKNRYPVSSFLYCIGQKGSEKPLGKRRRSPPKKYCLQKSSQSVPIALCPVYLSNEFNFCKFILTIRRSSHCESSKFESWNCESSNFENQKYECFKVLIFWKFNFRTFNSWAFRFWKFNFCKLKVELM